MNRCSVGFHKYVRIDGYISLFDIMDKIVKSYDVVLQEQIRECILKEYNVIMPEILQITYPGRKVCIKCGKIKNKILKHGQRMLKAVNKRKVTEKKNYLKKCKAKKLFLLELLKTLSNEHPRRKAIENRILELDKIIFDLTEGGTNSVNLKVRETIKEL